MTVMRHWIARAPHGDRVARVLDTAEKADHYRDIAWDVTGPFVPEADAGAVDLLRELREYAAAQTQDAPEQPFPEDHAHLFERVDQLLARQ